MHGHEPYPSADPTEGPTGLRDPLRGRKTCGTYASSGWSLLRLSKRTNQSGNAGGKCKSPHFSCSDPIPNDFSTLPLHSLSIYLSVLREGDLIQSVTLLLSLTFLHDDCRLRKSCLLHRWLWFVVPSGLQSTHVQYRHCQTVHVTSTGSSNDQFERLCSKCRSNFPQVGNAARR